MIANRRCLAWLRKKRVQTQPLEEMDIAMTERRSYSSYRREATDSPMGDRHLNCYSRCDHAWRQQPILGAFPAPL